MKLEKLQTYLIHFFLFLIPLFFLPLTRDFFDFNKNLLLFVFALVLLILYAAKTLLEKRLVFKLSPLDLPMVLFFAALLLSLIFVVPNKADSLISPLGSGTYFTLIMVYFLLRQFSLSRKSLFYPLVASSAVLGFFSLLQFTTAVNFLPLPDFMKNRLFTPAGSLLNLFTFLLVSLVIAVYFLYKENQKKIKTDYKNILLFTASLFIFLGIVFTLISFAKKENRPLFLPYAGSWSIAAETLKKPLNGLLGAGPGNYVNAFSLYRPAEINQQAIWNVRFASSANLYLQILTELGILGLAVFIFLLVRLFQQKLKLESLLFPALILILVFFLPANFLLVFTLFLFLAETAGKLSKASFVLPKTGAGEEKEFLVQALSKESFDKSDSSQTAFLIAPLILVALAGFYLAGRVFAAEFLMTKSLVQAARGNAQLTYDLQKQAIVNNPYYSPYRAIFSQTNFALALLISQKSELTEEDQNTLSQLVIQAINNAKVAVNLNPSPSTWENLALFYRRIINVNQEAFSWSVTAYNQAVILDPTNPLLRIAFGQLYYSVRNFDLAVRQFEIAVTLKDDFANSWYNLANAYRESGRITQSRRAYEKTLTLVDKEANASDYERVQAELDALPKEPEQPAAQAELQTLTSPASPSAEIQQEVAISEEEAAPPETALTPPPTATESSELEEGEISPTL